jgi:hypothetical protein
MKPETAWNSLDVTPCRCGRPTAKTVLQLEISGLFKDSVLSIIRVMDTDEKLYGHVLCVNLDYWPSLVMLEFVSDVKHS